MDEDFSVDEMLSLQLHSTLCEMAINNHIRELFNSSYTYSAVYAYFDRDDIALKGLAKFFKDLSDLERENAFKLIKYQNTRGGRVEFFVIEAPPSDYVDVEKGDALRAMELALGIEKTTYQKLQTMNTVATQQDDGDMIGFLQREFLADKVKTISKIKQYITQLTMIGKNGHDVWDFDRKLLHQL